MDSCSGKFLNFIDGCNFFSKSLSCNYQIEMTKKSVLCQSWASLLWVKIIGLFGQIGVGINSHKMRVIMANLSIGLF